MNDTTINHIAPLCLDGLETSLAQTTVSAHDKLVAQKGFCPELTACQIEEMTEKVISVTSSSFCTIYGIPPESRYNDLFDQIADFAEKIAKDHIFDDGNKRTTVVLCLALLIFAGVSINIDDFDAPDRNEIYQWIQHVVTGERTTEQLALFLRENSDFVGS